MPSIGVGARVKYAARFLRSIGIHTGDMCFAVGVVDTVKSAGGMTLAAINWGGADLPHIVNVKNLVRERQAEAD